MFFTTGHPNSLPFHHSPSPTASPAYVPPDPTETIWSRQPPLKRWRRRLLGLAYRFPDTGLLGLTPLKTHIVICGYPRAGTTLLLAMMEHALPHARRFRGEISAWRAATFAWRNHSVVLTKKPDDIFALHRLRNFYAGRDANLRILLMVRDPRDVLTSRHATTGPHAYFEQVDAWRVCHEYVRLYRHDPDVLVVRYRDLVTQTGTTRRRIEAFTGVRSERGYKDFHNASLDDFDTRPLNGIRPVDASTIGRWRDPEHRERIEQILREVPDFCDILVEMGYEPDAGWVDEWRREVAQASSPQP